MAVFKKKSFQFKIYLFFFSHFIVSFRKTTPFLGLGTIYIYTIYYLGLSTGLPSVKLYKLKLHEKRYHSASERHCRRTGLVTTNEKRRTTSAAHGNES